MMRPQINLKKIAELPTGEALISARHGEEGTASRLEFESKSRAWYYAEILRDARKEVRMTQQELADKIGKKRSYIAQLEKGETDMQLSTFLMIAEALGLRFALTY